VAEFSFFSAAKGCHTPQYMVKGFRSTRGPPALDRPRRTKSAVAQRRCLTVCQGWSEAGSATIGV
jgi:hypothetical protein